MSLGTGGPGPLIFYREEGHRLFVLGLLFVCTGIRYLLGYLILLQLM